MIQDGLALGFFSFASTRTKLPSLQFRRHFGGSAQVDLVEKDERGGDISGFTSNGEWALIEVPSKRTVQYYR